MTEAVTTQPVAETPNAQPQAGAEVQPAARNPQGSNLDDVLREYDEQVPVRPASAQPEPTPSAAPAKPAAPDPALASIQQRFFRMDMDKTVKDIRGQLDPELFDDGLVEAWLNLEASKDPRLGRAWLERDVNPAQFEKVKAALGKSFAGYARKFSKQPDANTTADVEAVAAAVRGASTRTPEPRTPDFGRMNNAEFDAERAKIMG